MEDLHQYTFTSWYGSASDAILAQPPLSLAKILTNLLLIKLENTKLPEIEG